MTVLINKPGFNLRDALVSLKRKIGIKGAELMAAETVSDIYSVIGTNRNKIINGDMRINQRGTTVQTFNDVNNVWIVDRFTGASLSDGGITGEQSTDAPTGFSNSIKCTVTSADASLSSTQYARIYLQNEGLNVSDFAWGTTNAATVTLSFWVKSSVTGTFGGTFQNSARDRSFAFNYTVNTANTWEYKTIIIVGDVTGTWLKDNSTGIRIAWGLAAGSTYQQSNVGVWESTGVKFAPSNAINLLATNGATFYITGVQLEKGTVATPFEHRPYGTELALCQRYYQRGFNFGSAYGVNNGSGSTWYGHGKCHVTMRATPTASIISGVSPNVDMMGAGVRAYVSGTPLGKTPNSWKWDMVFDGGAIGAPFIGVLYSDSIECSAEL